MYRMEIWRDIQGYEGIYKISNLGRVKSLNRIDSLGRNVPEKIKAIVDNGNGYKVVNLKRNGKQKLFTIHRLVAKAFIPNPDNLPCVNHKDENKANNYANNLEWCTHEYNNNYGTCRIRSAVSNVNNPKISKKIRCVETGIIYPSIAEAARQLRIYDSNIVACLHR